MNLNLLKKYLSWAKVLTFAFALSSVMFFFPTTAMAYSCSPGDEPVTPGSAIKSIPIRPGEFSVDTGIVCLQAESYIRSVKVSVEPPTAQVFIDNIDIFGPQGREFGCMPSRVRTGENLIRYCGGPAILQPGDTRYQAKGKAFGADSIKLTVSFSPNFEP